MDRKIFSFLMAIPFILSADINKIFTFNKPEVRNNVVYMKGCRTSIVPFAPCLATKPVTLLLPQGEAAVSFDVKYSEPVALEGAYYIAPFRPAGRISVPPPKDYRTRLLRMARMYNVDAFYPSDVKSPRFFTHYRYGHPIFIANLRPVQYNPISGKVRYFNRITVTVTTQKKQGPLAKAKLDPFIKSQLQLEVDNPEVLEGVSYTPKDADDYEYAIITPNTLRNSWSDFVAFNKRRCLRTKIATIESINASFSGSTPADKLKNYLKEEYENHNIMYVMLGGDDNISTSNAIQSNAITHKSYTAEFKDYGINYYRDQDIAADMFYETLDGQELEDLEWELYAARFPVDNTTELQRMIDKTIKYSETPVTNAIQKAIIAGEEKWPNINGGICWGKDQMLLLKGTTDKNGYTTTGIPDSWSLTELYEADFNWTPTNMLNAINSGVNFLLQTGHSNNFTVMKLSLTNNDIAKLQNTAYYIGYTTGCYPGAWDNRKIASDATFNTGHYADDCIVEEFMGGTGNGSVAFISNTRFGLADDGHATTDATDGSTIRFMRYFLNALFSEKMHHIAIMHAYSKWINKQEIINTDIDDLPYFGQMAYCAFELNVCGDPALSIWTETPEELNPDYPSPLSSTTFEWNTAMPYTWVALLDEQDSIIATQLTGVDGMCTITDQALADYVSANPSGMLKIHVKAHNYLPFRGELPISATNIIHTTDPYLFISRFTAGGNSMRISYRLPGKSLVTIGLYDAKGNYVKQLVHRIHDAGNHSLGVNNNTLSSGMYYCRMSCNNTSITNKCILVK